MLKGFNLTLRSSSELPSSVFDGELPDYTLSRGLDANPSDKVEKALQEYIVHGGALDGSHVQDDWFPNFPNCNVFISHSRNDGPLAMALAGWLSKTFELKSFIDSEVWGHADRLLEQIDKKYCMINAPNLYSYKKRNLSTSHVHMMLITALAKMIDQTECFIFLNTPQSTTRVGSKDPTTTTSSPWLFAELAIARTIRRRIPKRLLPKTIGEEKIAAAPQINYSITEPLAKLESIDKGTLEQWAQNCEGQNDTHPLDALYDMPEGG